jgi:hypothetical protein
MVGDIAGVPVTEGDLRVQSWSPEDFDITEWSCRPHAWDYWLEGSRSRTGVRDQRYREDYEK